MEGDILKYVLIVLALLGMNERAYSMPPEQLFESKWSEQCASENGVETSEYMAFSATERCLNFVDTFRVQSECQPAKFKALDSNRLLMTVKDEGTYIIEFLWASQISIMEVINEKPLKLKQTSILGRAETRDNLVTHYLYCP